MRILMNISASTVFEIKKWLADQHIVVPTDWVEACIDFLNQESNNVSFSALRLKQLVFDQWLDSDVCDINAPTLPLDLSSAHKIILNEYFTLQVNSITDIGRPAYAQLRQLEGQENGDVEISAAPKPFVPLWESKPTRMLLMNLTDGVNFVQGMEYQPIPALSPNLMPGFKVRISGPVECRFGILLLTSEKIQVLGGEVDKLKVENSRENVLRRILQVPITEESTRQTQITDESTGQLPITQNSSDFYPSSRSIANLPTNSREHSSSSMRYSTTENISSDADASTIIDEFDEDDFVNDLDYSALDEIEKANIRSDVEFDDGEINEDEEMLKEVYEYQEKSNFFPSDNNILLESDTYVENVPSTKSCETLGSIDQEKVVEKEFFITIKGFIVKVLSRLECKSSRGWHLFAKISDNTSSIDADFHDDVLKNFVGVSAKDMMAMQQQAKQNAEIKTKMLKAIDNCKNKLQCLNCFMKIKFSPNSKPCVIECTEYEKS